MKLFCFVFLSFLVLYQGFGVLPQTEYEVLVEEVSGQEFGEGCDLEDANKLQFWDIFGILKALRSLSKWGYFLEI